MTTESEEIFKEIARECFIQDVTNWCLREGIVKRDIPEVIKQALQDLDRGIKYG